MSFYREWDQPWIYTKRRMLCLENMNPCGYYRALRRDWLIDIGYCIDRSDNDKTLLDVVDFVNLLEAVFK